MEAQFAGKRVPWSDLDEYLSVHKLTIQAYLDLLKSESMDKATIETFLPKSFWKIHLAVTKIL
jgi:hypothetical protein